MKNLAINWWKKDKQLIYKYNKDFNILKDKQLIYKNNKEIKLKDKQLIYKNNKEIKMLIIEKVIKFEESQYWINNY